MLMASIDDHARSLLEISPIHQRIADRTPPILDRIVERIASIDTRRGRFSFQIAISRRRRRSIDESIESILGRPEPETFRTFLNFEATHFARGHPALTARASQLRQSRLRRLWIERHAASKTETRIIQVSRVTLWTDQAAAINDLDDSRSAVVAELVLVLRDRAAGTTSANRCISRLRRRCFERLATTTIERAIRHHPGHIVLGMTI